MINSNNIHLIIFDRDVSLVLLCILLFILILLEWRYLMCSSCNVGVKILISIIGLICGRGRTGISRGRLEFRGGMRSMGTVRCTIRGFASKIMILLGLLILYPLPQNIHSLLKVEYTLFCQNLEISTYWYPACRSWCTDRNNFSPSSTVYHLDQLFQLVPRIPQEHKRNSKNLLCWHFIWQPGYGKKQLNEL